MTLNINQSPSRNQLLAQAQEVKQQVLKELIDKGLSQQQAVESINVFETGKAFKLDNKTIEQTAKKMNDRIENSLSQMSIAGVDFAKSALLLNPSKVITPEIKMEGARSFELKSESDLSLKTDEMSLEQLLNAVVPEDNSLNIVSPYQPYVTIQRRNPNYFLPNPETLGQNYKPNSFNAAPIPNVTKELHSNSYDMYQASIYNEYSVFSYNTLQGTFTAANNALGNLSGNLNDVNAIFAQIKEKEVVNQLMMTLFGNSTSSIKGLLNDVGGITQIGAVGAAIPAELDIALNTFASSSTAENGNAVAQLIANIENIVNGMTLIDANGDSKNLGSFEKPILLMPYNASVVKAFSASKSYNVYRNEFFNPAAKALNSLLSKCRVILTQFCSADNKYNQQYVAGKNTYLLYDASERFVFRNTVIPLSVCANGTFTGEVSLDAMHTKDGVIYNYVCGTHIMPYVALDNTRRLKTLFT